MMGLLHHKFWTPPGRIMMIRVSCLKFLIWQNHQMVSLNITKLALHVWLAYAVKHAIQTDIFVSFGFFFLSCSAWLFI